MNENLSNRIIERFNENNINNENAKCVALLNVTQNIEFDDNIFSSNLFFNTNNIVNNVLNEDELVMVQNTEWEVEIEKSNANTYNVRLLINTVAFDGNQYLIRFRWLFYFIQNGNIFISEPQYINNIIQSDFITEPIIQNRDGDFENFNIENDFTFGIVLEIYNIEKFSDYVISDDNINYIINEDPTEIHINDDYILGTYNNRYTLVENQAVLSLSRDIDHFNCGGYEWEVRFVENNNFISFFIKSINNNLRNNNNRYIIAKFAFVLRNPNVLDKYFCKVTDYFVYFTEDHTSRGFDKFISLNELRKYYFNDTYNVDFHFKIYSVNVIDLERELNMIKLQRDISLINYNQINRYYNFKLNFDNENITDYTTHVNDVSNNNNNDDTE